MVNKLQRQYRPVRWTFFKCNLFKTHLYHIEFQNYVFTKTTTGLKFLGIFVIIFGFINGNHYGNILAELVFYGFQSMLGMRIIRWLLALIWNHQFREHWSKFGNVFWVVLFFQNREVSYLKNTHCIQCKTVNCQYQSDRTSEKRQKLFSCW